jgi:uncharacterized protein DUF4381
MNEPATSLDRLHDIALPPAVAWWPPAPGWYVVFTLALVAAAWMAFRAWKRWQSNAYRREAARELASLESSAAIAELLRRTALAIAPRSVIAEKTGTAWLDWLAAQFPEPMPDTVRAQLTTGVYGRPAASRELSALRDYATRWITRHRQEADH